VRSVLLVLVRALVLVALLAGSWSLLVLWVGPWLAPVDEAVWIGLAAGVVAGFVLPPGG
jgi:hypothetical protein